MINFKRSKGYSLRYYHKIFASGHTANFFGVVSANHVQVAECKTEYSARLILNALNGKHKNVSN